MRSAEFSWSPMEAPFADGLGSMDMSMSETGELIRRKYEFLGNLVPKGEIYGHPTVEGFVDDVVQTVDEKGSTDIEIMGEPLSGKSYAAGQLGAILSELGVTPYYIPWVDVIRDARTTGVIPPDSPFGGMGSLNYGRVSEFFYALHKAVAKATDGERSVRIGEAPGIPTIEAYQDAGLVIADRGATAMMRLIQEGGYIMGLYASAPVRDMGRDFRSELDNLDPENVAEKLDEYGLTTTVDSDHAVKIFKESGAPFSTLDHYAEVVNNTVLFLGHPEVNYLELDERTLSRQFLEEHPKKRTEIVGKQLLPYLIAERFGAREDQALIAFNKRMRHNKKINRYDMEQSHYRNVVDIFEVATQVAEPQIDKLSDLFY